MENSKKSEIKEKVKNHYAELISNSNKKTAGCCSRPSDSETSGIKSESCCGAVSAIATSSNTGWAESIGYDKNDLSYLPVEAVGNTFGCGAPLSNTEIKEGDVVLDLGSGAGLDILLASKLVGKTGKAIGLDMTPEMIEKATKNVHKMGVDNVEVLNRAFMNEEIISQTGYKFDGKIASIKVKAVKQSN